MEKNGISFAREIYGYNREQVNSYIKKVGDAYNTTYSEYRKIADKYESLLEDSKKAKPKEQSGLDPDAIKRTLMNAEILALKIIEDAYAEVSALMAEAQNAKSIADAEAAIAKETARKLVDDAKAEAAIIANWARSNFEQANKTMAQATSEVRRYLSNDMAERENALAPDGMAAMPA